MLAQEIEHYNDNINEWLKSESGKFVLIKGKETIGFFNTIGEALIEGTRRYGLESYLVRQILPMQQDVEIPAMTIGILYANPAYPIQG